VASRNFLDDAATPPCGDARRGIRSPATRFRVLQHPLEEGNMAVPIAISPIDNPQSYIYSFIRLYG